MPSTKQKRRQKDVPCLARSKMEKTTNSSQMSQTLQVISIISSKLAGKLPMTKDDPLLAQINETKK